MGPPVVGDERTQTARAKMPLVMSANINPGYIQNSRRYLKSESSCAYTFKPAERVDKAHHFVKDPVKDFVEKALTLHDDRHGMAVVASPVWVPPGRSAGVLKVRG
ncbi:hypothetical protein AB1Y20_010074 [Prymnesium parvum]|uniref:Uncharacterized protein n=1 Tax=Prymnesium parvum TaxID=97485 RepID=A0AB34K5U1_PRYPA